ncbi:alpha-2-macroglobulin family protein [Aestuariivivens sediminicola]|uniref:alpha-2-macroglobulin family protein n=1 Tax=Aestuariivivens sediminicola TaxID=2913560 RepID=UPI001F57119C|nr:MG2 domain-containing protein [Aestuariivivens sediminicola]
MKHALSLLIILLFSSLIEAQTTNYEDLWHKVEQYEKDGLPQSALKIVTAIGEKARKDGNSQQRIKSMLYQSKYALILEEEAQLNIIAHFKSEINNTTFPVKNILESILADLYWQYFNQNRWKFYQRTKLDPSGASVSETDFRTWDLQTLFNVIHLHYQNSLDKGSKLQLEDLEAYDALLVLQKDSKRYRPTLFDFLCHRALAFYKSSETQITQPAFSFEIDHPKYLGAAEPYSTLELTSRDTMSLQLNALNIYKQLIQFHLKDSNPLALVDVNIERLHFVHQYTSLTDKDALLLEVLNREKSKIKDHEASGLYDFEIASLYHRQSKDYQPKTDERHRWKAKEALAICNAVISRFPESKASEQCKLLKSQIEHPWLQITSEKMLPLQQHGRLLVKYKNLNALHFKVFKIAEDELERFSKLYRKEEQLEFIDKLKIKTQWSNTLRNERDYQIHSTELVIPELGNGNYLIFASAKNHKSTFAFSTIQVTNIALVECNGKNVKTFQVIDRNNGSPINGADVTLTFYKNYNKEPHQEFFKTNSLGEFRLEKSKDRYRNIVVRVKYENDTAHFGNYFKNALSEQVRNDTDFKAFIFTDRSIYRPGQTVFFKAIAMRTTKDTSEIVANEPVKAVLYNTNDEALAELELRTNAFGSVSGEFILPTDGLNGTYHIEFDGDEINFFTEHYFSVEEYKRPTFETQFHPINQIFRVNDSVVVKAVANAYAGSPVTNAKVVYRVQRTVRYPRWYSWGRPAFFGQPQEIGHGETVTNEKGAYEIAFRALPDQSIDKGDLPVFTYEITADVTDINGETRSAATVVKVGYHALVANMTLPTVLDKTKKDHKILIETKNLNDEFVPAKGLIKIYKLEAPNTVLRQRPWAAPDYQDIDEKTFKTLFPHDAYNDEHDPNHWEKGDLVFETKFDTHSAQEVALGNIRRWASGAYIIILETRDPYGQFVKDEIRTVLFSEQDRTIADNQLFSFTTDATQYAIGDTALLTLASAADALTVTLKLEKNHQIVKTEIIELGRNKKTFSIPIESNDLGGFSIHYSYAAFNSFESGTIPISVPYPKTELEIETLTFRDKLQPGSEETWSFKIKGPYGEQLSAELLAGMYDVSLDQFKPHQWNFSPLYRPIYTATSNSNAYHSFGTKYFRAYNERLSLNASKHYYDQLNWFGFSFGQRNILIRGVSSVSDNLNNDQADANPVEFEDDVLFKSEAAALEEEVTVGYGLQEETEGGNLKDGMPGFKSIQIRKHLQETAFFFPHLQTDTLGHISFRFSTPEALTQWKLQLLAHTKTLQSATKILTAVTQKELMIIPNAPRFLREGDTLFISTKIANLTKEEMSGQATLILTDAISGEDLSKQLVIPQLSNYPNADNRSDYTIQNFTVDAEGNTQVSWQMYVPDHMQAIQYKIVAKSDNYSDGEQNTLPVLSNRILVTETLPMWIKSNETRTFELDKLKQNTSNTLRHHKLTLEMTSNPVWYAVQALPYLMEYPYDCNEQIFARYYGNALGHHIVTSNSKIHEVFKQWTSQDALLSNLEKNEELKSVLIQETPWLRDAQSETEQKKRIGLLFNLNKMDAELQSSLRKLKQNQMASGAWSWFNGGPDNRFITQHIMSGFGQLYKLGIIGDTTTLFNPDSGEESMIQKAISYLDAAFVKEYKDLKKHNEDSDLSQDHLSYTQLHYLYMRSFFPNVITSPEVKEIMDYYQLQIQTYWLKKSLYAKGLMALICFRNKNTQTSAKILKSLVETSITNEELGMYWKTNVNSWHWYQAPIETQALFIALFDEAGTTVYDEAKTTELIDHLKIWLLKHKQTNQWKTTKATTDAIYALLLQGSDWLSIADGVDIRVGDERIVPLSIENTKIEAGTGYFKTSWSAPEITPNKSTVRLTKKGKGMAWGGLYWQYFEDMDKISSAKTPLKLQKKLYLKTFTDLGEQIKEITDTTTLNVGDAVRVRIELQSDRDMEFVHMKDMRASGLEPVNVLSQYKWQDGLGYYESTKDVSTNFFFEFLPKGIYVFEYDLRVINAGDMSNGVTTIQSMYAPEFSSHSKGSRIKVE